jgi:hypothetical protein
MLGMVALLVMTLHTDLLPLFTQFAEHISHDLRHGFNGPTLWCLAYFCLNQNVKLNQSQLYGCF